METSTHQKRTEAILVLSTRVPVHGSVDHVVRMFGGVRISEAVDHVPEEEEKEPTSSR